MERTPIVKDEGMSRRATLLLERVHARFPKCGHEVFSAFLWSIESDEQLVELDLRTYGCRVAEELAKRALEGASDAGEYPMVSNAAEFLDASVVPDFVLAAWGLLRPPYVKPRSVEFVHSDLGLAQRLYGCKSSPDKAADAEDRKLVVHLGQPAA